MTTSQRILRRGSLEKNYEMPCPQFQNHLWVPWWMIRSSLIFAQSTGGATNIIRTIHSLNLWPDTTINNWSKRLMKSIQNNDKGGCDYGKEEMLSNVSSCVMSISHQNKLCHYKQWFYIQTELSHSIMFCHSKHEKNNKWIGSIQMESVHSLGICSR